MALTEDVKSCSKCHVTKPLSGFVKGKGRGGVRAICKDCYNLYQKNRYERISDSERPARRLSSRKAHLKSKYGITPEQYLMLLEKQGGRCAICSKPEEKSHRVTGASYSLAVDHCHESGRVRGLLCLECNSGLGKLGDSLDRIIRVLEYLEEEIEWPLQN